MKRNPVRPEILVQRKKTATEANSGCCVEKVAFVSQSESQAETQATASQTKTTLIVAMIVIAVVVVTISVGIVAKIIVTSWLDVIAGATA
jgi:hypothetical protein